MLFTAARYHYTTILLFYFFICFISSMFSISSAFISVLHLPLLTYPEHTKTKTCYCVGFVCFYNGILAFSLRSLLCDTALFITCAVCVISFALYSALSTTKTFFFLLFYLFAMVYEYKLIVVYSLDDTSTKCNCLEMRLSRAHPHKTSVREKLPLRV